MKITTLRTLTFLSFVAVATAACKTKTDSAVQYVAVKDGLNMRAEPSPTGRKILTIPYGQSVQKLEEKAEVFTIAKTPGKWTKVSWKDKTGWVFGGFLSSYVSGESTESATSTSGNSAVANRSIEEHFTSIKFEYYVGQSFYATKSLGETRIDGESGGGRHCNGSGVHRDAQQGFESNGYIFQAVGQVCGADSANCTRGCTIIRWHCSIMASDILATPRGGTLKKAQCDETRT